MGLGLRPVIIDTDATRVQIFGTYPDTIDRNSDEMRRIRRCTYDAIFHARIPDVLGAGGIPIVTATHSHAEHYPRAAEIATRFGAVLRFIVLETPPLVEADRRSRVDIDSASDFKNFFDDPIKMEEFKRVAKAMDELYRIPHGSYFWVSQGTPEQMTKRALRHLAQFPLVLKRAAPTR